MQLGAVTSNKNNLRGLLLLLHLQNSDSYNLLSILFFFFLSFSSGFLYQHLYFEGILSPLLVLNHIGYSFTMSHNALVYQGVCCVSRCSELFLKKKRYFLFLDRFCSHYSSIKFVYFVLLTFPISTSLLKSQCMCDIET